VKEINHFWKIGRILFPVLPMIWPSHGTRIFPLTISQPILSTSSQKSICLCLADYTDCNRFISKPPDLAPLFYESIPCKNSSPVSSNSLVYPASSPSTIRYLYHFPLHNLRPCHSAVFISSPLILSPLKCINLVTRAFWLFVEQQPGPFNSLP